MPFPAERPRRFRRNAKIRDWVRETALSPSDLILPIFVREGKSVKQEIKSMPGVYQYSPDTAQTLAAEASALGIPALILFGIPEHKDAQGSSAWDAKGPVAQSIAAIKDKCPELVLITDVCMCEYTDHGHCGALSVDQSDVENDATLELLQKEALAHAEAGADIVAPSDMMDGRVRAIRQALDQNGFSEVSILSYAAKYASGFYGPFRDAAESAPNAGPSDRKSYQMDAANRREALREVKLDLEEGADMVMVKPALSYLDVISDVRKAVDVPVAAYNVSGEYAMLKAAAQAGAIDEKKVMLEILTSIKRAGADMILSYHALQAAKELA